ncbi:MAG TPA: hypothetical protein VGZ26_07080, partial [Pirellulales bacterium]|nr:hypothetical protein [Pirellulales bacterium]
MDRIDAYPFFGTGGPFVVSGDRECIRLDTRCRRAAERSDLGVVADTLTFFRYSRGLGLGFDQFWDWLPEENAPPDNPEDGDPDGPAIW